MTMDFMVKMSTGEGWSTKFHSGVYLRHPHDGEIKVPGPTPRSPDRDYKGDGNWTPTARDTKGKASIPEPFRLLPSHQTPLDCSFQNLIRECNPEHKDDIVDNVLDQAWILANNTGIGADGRKNCRNGDYMDDPEARWPALHDVIVCGGAILKQIGVVDGYVYLESIMISKPAPPAQYVLERPWLWFWLVATNDRNQITYMTVSAKDGVHRPVRMPFITSRAAYCRASWLHKLPAGFFPPSPMWIP